LQFDSKPQFWQYLFGICKKETQKRQQWQKVTINWWHTSNKQLAVKKQQAIYNEKQLFTSNKKGTIHARSISSNVAGQ